jgi:dUTP pyrophosphatase
MKVKIKKLVENAVIPQYAKEGDAGLDLVATSVTQDDYGNIVYGTGIAVEIPKGYVGLVFPRSSNAKTNLYLTNSVGVIDSGYRGEIMFKYKCVHNVSSYLKFLWQKYIRKMDTLNISVHTLVDGAYNVGDRVGQLIIIKYPYIEFEEVDKLSETERGTGGYGSSGK